MGAVWIGARLPQAPDRVYLDATGLSIGSVHHAEKEQDMISRLQSAGEYPAFSGGHCK
jgi:hypothetical protein